MWRMSKERVVSRSVSSTIRRFVACLWFIASLTLALGGVACQTNGAADTTSIPSSSSRQVAPLPPSYYVPASLDEQIFKSSLIVRATLKSATSTTKAVGSSYVAVQELRFTVHEYLKGSGASELLVVVYGDDLHTTEKKARTVALNSVASRTTTWDSRQAVIFLRPHEQSYSPIGAALTSNNKVLGFTLTNSPPQSNFEYAINTLSRVWLPASDTGATSTAAQSSGSGNVTFITDGAVSPSPVVTLAKLRSDVAQMEATLKAGEGVAGYKECIAGKITRERVYRASRLTSGPWTPLHFKEVLNSGSTAGVEIDKGFVGHGGATYNRFWVSGPDMAYFHAPIVDDDSKPGNGYYYSLSSSRPLPAGAYSIKYVNQLYTRIPCNHVPDDAYWKYTVTVTAPAGTLHEAFFDPIYATSSGEYRADASLGTLKPAGYRKPGDTATTTIHSIAWKAQQATLTTSPGALPANHHVDFIELDGSVSLRLDVDTATTTTGGGKHTLSWRICRQPWHAGDKLMLRIAQSGAKSVRRDQRRRLHNAQSQTHAYAGGDDYARRHHHAGSDDHAARRHHHAHRNDHSAGCDHHARRHDYTAGCDDYAHRHQHAGAYARAPGGPAAGVGLHGQQPGQGRAHA